MNLRYSLKLLVIAKQIFYNPDFFNLTWNEHFLCKKIL